MKERPILFSAPMVRAILDGRKTQTRRVVKGVALDWLRPHRFIPEFVANPGNHLCPYGQPGDRLWVRESWHQRGKFVFALSESDKSSWLGTREIAYSADTKRPGHDWRSRPSIHMPRWASRILLEITGVRVERLQDISEDDAKTEGAWGPDASIVSKVAEHFGRDPLSVHPSLAFRMLWESINGANSWEANPWVWVIEFKRSET